MTPDDVNDARGRIADQVRRTPVLTVTPDDLPGLTGPVVLKLELLQHAGSFKPRGAANRVLAERERRGGLPPAGLVTASGGNHGAAVS